MATLKSTTETANPYRLHCLTCREMGFETEKSGEMPAYYKLLYELTSTIHFEALFTYNLVSGCYLLNSFVNCFSLETEKNTIDKNMNSTLGNTSQHHNS